MKKSNIPETSNPPDARPQKQRLRGICYKMDTKIRSVRLDRQTPTKAYPGTRGISRLTATHSDVVIPNVLNSEGNMVRSKIILEPCFGRKVFNTRESETKAKDSRLGIQLVASTRGSILRVSYQEVRTCGRGNGFPALCRHQSLRLCRSL